jgi:hypothetical protein
MRSCWSNYVGIYYHEVIQLTRGNSNPGLLNEQLVGKVTTIQRWNRRSPSSKLGVNNYESSSTKVRGTFHFYPSRHVTLRERFLSQFVANFSMRRMLAM